MSDVPIFRVAVRTEGAWICAYIANMESMDGALKIATLLKSTADSDRAVFEAWLVFLQGQVDRLFARFMGERGATRVTRNKPDTLEPAEEPEQYRSALAQPWPTFETREPPPDEAPAIVSGGGGDFTGGGASGSWDEPAASPADSPAAAPADSPSVSSD